MSGFTDKYIIKTYEPWYVNLSNGEKIECKITKGWEYEIETHWRHKVNGEIYTYFFVVYNLNNGYNKPYEKIEKLKIEAENIIKKEKKRIQPLTIFDFIEA